MATKLVSRLAVAFALEARANAIERQHRPDRVQAHSRLLPTEVELAQAEFAARQFRVAADEMRAGLEEDTASGSEVTGREGNS